MPKHLLKKLKKKKEGREKERENYLRFRGSFLASVSRSLCILGNDDAPGKCLFS